MGSITRTQFGCTKTVTLTAADIVAASVAPLVIVPGIPGRIFVPFYGLARLSWVMDFGNVDVGAFMVVGVGAALLGDLESAGGIPFLANSDDMVVELAKVNNVDGLASAVAGEPIEFSVNNQASGALTGGTGNLVTLEAHYLVI